MNDGSKDSEGAEAESGRGGQVDGVGDADTAPSSSRFGISQIVTRVLGAMAGAAALYLVLSWLGAPLGARWSPAVHATFALGAVVVACLPTRAYLVTALTGVAILLQWTALRTTGYHLLLLLGTFALRRRPVWLTTFLVVAVVVIPKELFRRRYHEPFWYDWVNPFLLAHLTIAVLLWWSADRRGRTTETSLSAWACLLIFPTHPINPLVYSPGDLWRPRTAGLRDVLISLSLVAAKATALLGLQRFAHGIELGRQSPVELLGASLPSTWAGVAVSYLIVALTLSGSADVVVAVARLFGWNLAHSFRFALLAWNPIELWRRWAIYNRKALLSLVYFPLGGGDRHRALNVMVTFAASGLVLHSGWLGSPYWEAGVGGWRDQTIYFLLQGLAVVACLQVFRWRGKDPASDRELRWSWGRVLGTLGTQALSAWLHVIIVTPQLTLGDRFRLMGRCLGLGAWLD